VFDLEKQFCAEGASTLNTKGVEVGVVQAVLEEHDRDHKQFRVPERLAQEVSWTLKSISLKLVLEAEKRLTEDC